MQFIQNKQGCTQTDGAVGQIECGKVAVQIIEVQKINYMTIHDAINGALLLVAETTQLTMRASIGGRAARVIALIACRLSIR